MPKRSAEPLEQRGGSASPAETAQRMLDRSNSRSGVAMRQQHRVVRRHREEQRRPIALDDVVDGGRRDGPGPQDGRRADGEREVHRVAEAVREEQLGHAEAAVRSPDAEHARA